MSVTEIKEQLQALPELAAWPELTGVFDRAGEVHRPDWQLPILACQAVGGGELAGLPAAGAVACVQLSIIIVDDMLDEDVRGAHRELGYGAAANLALAFQSAAFRLIDQTGLAETQRAAATACIAKVALATAVGQNLDVQNLEGEENYWVVVRAKSTPFYGGALQLGAILGGASPAQSTAMYKLGVIIGEIIQIEDDLEDALAVPASADWKQGRANLLILYATSADHKERDRFLALLPRSSDRLVLKELQQILIRCGAVSYSAYQLVARYHGARQMLGKMDLVDASSIEAILEDYAESLAALLRISGIDLTRKQLLEEYPLIHKRFQTTFQ